MLKLRKNPNFDKESQEEMQISQESQQKEIFPYKIMKKEQFLEKTGKFCQKITKKTLISSKDIEKT